MSKQSTPASALATAEAECGAQPRVSSSSLERTLTATAVIATVALLAYKFLLTRYLNINWDEFNFLSHVYTLMRGELTLLMLGAYTHLFTWLTWLPGDEIDQIVAARWVMMVLLCLTTWLVWRLGRVWLIGFPAVVPPFVYVSALPVMVHGGSFRFDSMLAPLAVAALLLVVGVRRAPQREWAAGVVLGVALAVSVKVALFAPLYLAVILLYDRTTSPNARIDWISAARSALRIVIPAVGLAAILLGLHRLTIAATVAESASTFAAKAVQKTLLDTPWFPRWDYFMAYASRQPLHWSLLGVGTLLALARKRFDLAALALSLLPLAFYRNAFPYFYVVMLAPACVLAGYAVQEVAAVARLRVSTAVASIFVATIWIGLLHQGLRQVGRLRYDQQQTQRAVISGVHEIFPEAVNYIDRCGMIPSFRKVNFFMSTWGIDNYRAGAQPFMPEAILKYQPAFVLLNTTALFPGGGLFDEDYDIIAHKYIPFWGPLRVAGAEVQLRDAEPAHIDVPFPADYRVVTPEAIIVDGVTRTNDEVVHVTGHRLVVRAARPLAQNEELNVRLVLGLARKPPVEHLPDDRLFTGL